MDARYLNVDCILRSGDNLIDLISFLKDDVFILWEEFPRDGSFVGFETNLINTNEPEEDIVEFLRLFDSLPSTLMRLLTGCYEKVFDIGFESGNTGDPLNLSINSDLINRVSKLGFSLNIRVYPIDSENT